LIVWASSDRRGVRLAGSMRRNRRVSPLTTKPAELVLAKPPSPLLPRVHE